MKTLRYGTTAWRRYVDGLPRADRPRPVVQRAVARIVREVEREGDAAVVRWTARLDGVRLRPAQIRMERSEVRRLAAAADRPVRRALGALAARIDTFHRRQLAPGFRFPVGPGSMVEEVVTPLASAGLYVPGGAGAYPSSVLMNAIPALAAGVRDLWIATPPRALEANPAVAAAIVEVGLEDRVIRVGGAQAVAALAFGTRTVPAVVKIAGPGNAYVAEAKRQVRGRVDVDREAGPSEVVVLADETADPGWVAADLLAQAEHGSGEETVVLITTSTELADETARLVAQGVSSVANRTAARRALARHGAIVLVGSLDEGVEALNLLAPEHAEVMTRGAGALAARVVAGAVFVGPWAPVAVGDYGVGPNHVLPTGGAARYASPLSVRDFQRRHSRVRLSRAGLARITEDVVRVAQAEGFRGHAQSVLTRFEA
ncbi:MAG TPA: histidinol dehydrogenase [Vicinamibacteria bacterium]|nr:histidinol dehydrogenase [Vicinamibacteria bacterium]